MSNTPKTTISWLHLSDFHIQIGKEWEQDVVLSSLAHDVENRLLEGNKPDLLILTGDIAFSGKAAEYVLAEKFIRKIMSITGIGSECVLIVPGNHDIDRNVQNFAFTGARSLLKDCEAVDRFFANTEERQNIFKRQKNFRDFVNRLAPPSSPYSEDSFFHVKFIKIGAINIKVLLLDSAWLAGDSADRNHLLVGERQLFDACSNGNIPALVLALIHHPLGWLNEFEQESIETLLLQNAHALFQGHVHRTDTRVISTSNHKLPILTAGASFETRTTNNSYGFGCVDLATGKGKACMYLYKPSKHNWEKQNNEENWLFSDLDSAPIPINKAYQTIMDINPKIIVQPAYLACLLANHLSEIPGKCGLEFEFMNLASPFIEEDISKAIIELRHLIKWKDIFTNSMWQLKVAQLMNQYQTRLNALIKEFPALDEQLTAKEETSNSFIRSINEASFDHHTPLFNQVLELIQDNDFEMAMAIAKRALENNMLEKNEQLKMEILRVNIFIAQLKMSDAIELIENIKNDYPANVEIMLLASSCYYEERNYSLASITLYQALDLGLDVNLAKNLALNIASQTGDKNLVERAL